MMKKFTAVMMALLLCAGFSAQAQTSAQTETQTQTKFKLFTITRILISAWPSISKS